MSGFLLHSVSESVDTIWPISLGRGRPAREYKWPCFRLAVIETCNRTVARLHRLADGACWLEGEARPLPSVRWSLAEWVARVDGSFRAIFVPDSGLTARLVVDPYGSRPIYYDERGGMVCASDKVVTLGVVSRKACELRWDVLLEALTVGCVLSEETSLRGVRQAPPASLVELAEGRSPVVSAYRRDWNSGGLGRRSLWADGIGLKRAVESSVAVSWDRRDYPLLLSGGFDSRWMLAISDKPRRSITCGPEECRETDNAKRLADRYAAEHETVLFGREKWRRMVTDGYLVTAGMYDPLKNHFLDIGERLAESGISGVAHGFLFDTLMKGCFAFPVADYVSDGRTPVLPRSVGLTAEWVFSRSYLESLRALLSDAGRDLMSEVVRSLAMRWGDNVHGDFDFSFERATVQHISRQIDMPLALNLMEHMAVQSPVFTRAIWDWHRQSQAAHRMPHTAYLVGLLLSAGRAGWLPKGDTGQLAISMLFRSVARRLVPGLGRIGWWGGVTKSSTLNMSADAQGRRWLRSAWGIEDTAATLREKETRQELTEGLACLEGEAIFARGALARLAEEAGEEGGADSHLVCFVASIGQLKQAVYSSGAGCFRDAIGTVERIEVPQWRSGEALA